MIQLEHKEKTIRIFRKHWFVIFLEALLFASMAIFPVVILWIMWRLIGGELIPPTGHIVTVLMITWVIILWIGFFITFTNYYLDVWMLTDRRLIDMDQKGLFSREVATVRIENIEDVTTNISGFFPSLLGYGNVYVQSAGAIREFTIRNVSDPNHVKALILREQHREYERPRPVRVV